MALGTYCFSTLPEYPCPLRAHSAIVDRLQTAARAQMSMGAAHGARLLFRLTDIHILSRLRLCLGQQIVQNCSQHLIVAIFEPSGTVALLDFYVYLDTQLVPRCRHGRPPREFEYLPNHASPFFRGPIG